MENMRKGTRKEGGGCENVKRRKKSSRENVNKRIK
jgi:hypothetical protein